MVLSTIPACLALLGVLCLADATASQNKRDLEGLVYAAKYLYETEQDILDAQVQVDTKGTSGNCKAANMKGEKGATSTKGHKGAGTQISKEFAKVRNAAQLLFTTLSDFEQAVYENCTCGYNGGGEAGPSNGYHVPGGYTGGGYYTGPVHYYNAGNGYHSSVNTSPGTPMNGGNNINFNGPAGNGANSGK